MTLSQDIGKFLLSFVEILSFWRLQKCSNCVFLLGTFSCQELYDSEKNGELATSMCSRVIPFARQVCVCKPSDAKEVNGFPSLSEGLIHLEFSDDKRHALVARPEEWNDPPYLPLFVDTNSMKNQSIPLLYNHMSDSKLADIARQVVASGQPGLTSVFTAGTDPTNFYAAYAADDMAPLATVFYPVFAPEGKAIAGTISLSLPWESLVDDTVPENGIYTQIVLESTCGDLVTFVVDPKGSNIKFEGFGDLHDNSFDDFEVSTTYTAFSDLVQPFHGIQTDGEVGCIYRFKVYPTQEFKNQYFTGVPWINSSIVFGVFCVTTVIFVVYDWVIRRRQEKIMESATRTNDIVSSLFPKQVRDRMYENTATKEVEEARTFLQQPSREQVSVYGSEPIADLYVAATVIFLDIAGFTGTSQCVVEPLIS